MLYSEFLAFTCPLATARGERAHSNGFGRSLIGFYHPLNVTACNVYSITARRVRLRGTGLEAPGFPIDTVRVPDPDPLAVVRYSCV